MRRDTFLKSLAAMAASGALPMSAWAAANMKMMIPANPGGGWDSTGRALGKALQDAGVASSVTYENKGGAAGAIGLAQFYNASKGDPNAMMVMGAVMLGGIITGKPPVSVTQLTPIARLTTEYNVFVLPAESPLKTMKDVVEQLKKDPGSVKWGGGSRGSTEHIAAAQIGVFAAQAAGFPAQFLHQPRAVAQARQGIGQRLFLRHDLGTVQPKVEVLQFLHHRRFGLDDIKQFNGQIGRGEIGIGQGMVADGINQANAEREVQHHTLIVGQR